MDGLAEPLRWLIAAPIYALAYGGAMLAFRAMARRRGMDTEGTRTVMLAGLLGGLIGANLAQALLGGAPGKTIEGGIAGGFVAVLLVKRSLGIRRSTGDLFAPAIALGEAIGRIGCFVGGCCYGKAAEAAIAVHEHGAPRHPAQLYASACAFVTFGVLIWVDRRGILPEGALLWLQLALFCLARFAIEFVREGRTLEFGLTLAQFACAAGFAYAGWKLRPLVLARRSATAHL